MIKLLAGGKGEGKTKKLIDMANAYVKTTDGHLVFIDDDKRHIFDLHYDIRFVETGRRLLSNYREFVGFILGVLSQDNDIKHIFVDGLTNIIEVLDSEALEKLARRLAEISDQNNVEFIICINWQTENLPESVKALLM